jgi:hypothetical protein
MLKAMTTGGHSREIRARPIPTPPTALMGLQGLINDAYLQFNYTMNGILLNNSQHIYFFPNDKYLKMTTVEVNTPLWELALSWESVL